MEKSRELNLIAVHQFILYMNIFSIYTLHYHQEDVTIVKRNMG